MFVLNSKKSKGFTLVEIAIVMMIIGIALGAVFGGVRLMEISQISSEIKKIKSYEAATNSFKTIYGLLPGDIREPANMLNNCANFPCNRAGNGNGQIVTDPFWLATSSNAETFAYWKHLFAAELIEGVDDSDSADFGRGQPLFEINDASGGVRIMSNNQTTIGDEFFDRQPHFYVLLDHAFGELQRCCGIIPARTMSNMDIKYDDGHPNRGIIRQSFMNETACATATGVNGVYLTNTTNRCVMLYITNF